MESHDDDPPPAPRGRVPVVVLMRFKTVPSPGKEPPEGSGCSENTAPGGRQGGGQDSPGQDSPSQAPGKAYASQSGAGRILGSGEQGDSRGIFPRVIGGPQTTAPAWERELDHPATSVQEREAAGGEERRGSSGSLECSTPGQAPAGPREGLPMGSPVPSATGPDSAPSNPAVCQPGGGLGPTARRASGSS